MSSEAIRLSATRLLTSIVNRRAVLDAHEAIEAMIARLCSPEPVAVKGMAMAERIVTDGLTSPLYNWSAPASLTRLLLVATAELDARTARAAGRRVTNRAWPVSTRTCRPGRRLGGRRPAPRTATARTPGMDTATIDQAYQQLQTEFQDVANSIQTLAEASGGRARGRHQRQGTAGHGHRTRPRT